MNRHLVVLAVLGMFVVWGCGQPPSSASSGSLKALEARVSRLEQDLKLTQAARDQALAQAKALGDQLKLTQSKARTLEQERDFARVELQNRTVELQSRTTERDALQVQFEGFRKNLRDLLGQVDTALQTVPSPNSDAIGNSVKLYNVNAR